MNPDKLSREQFAKYFDHTFLKPAGEPDAVRRLCREAKKFGFASVCVNPCEVARAAKSLKGSGVKVCTVVGFPLGQNTTLVKTAEAYNAVRNGADELDFVINVRLLKDAARCSARARKDLAEELLHCAETGGFADVGHVVTKLIIECCYLTDEEKVLACTLAKEAGFDFVKTSTGFGTGGATVKDVKLMRKTVGRRMGVKAAGGVRTLADAFAFIKAGATRLGCSSSVSIMQEFENLILA